ncbi:MAG: hypothetical protein IJQ20_04395 [Paludibacteraceae bacterium]|nr:hypothetical protein [Paludibacteraceae bacterium]
MLKISISTVRYHLCKLQKDGVIVRYSLSSAKLAVNGEWYNSCTSIDVRNMPMQI